MSYEALNPRGISGTWKGTYQFDLEDQRLVDGAGVAFELVLSQGWYQRLLGWFSGTVTDDPDRGMPGVGEILGVCRFPKVRFTKQMPVMYFRDGRRQVSFREWLVEQGHGPGQDVPHSPIYYVGQFGSDGTLSGTWSIVGRQFRLANGLMFSSRGSTGTWVASRKS